MTLATFLVLCKLACGPALQLAGQAAGNVHQDVIGYQAVQIAYYQATAAYWNAQRRPCCCKVKRKRLK